MASTDVTQVLQLLIDVQLALRIRMISASVEGDSVCDMARGQEQLEDRTKPQFGMSAQNTMCILQC